MWKTKSSRSAFERSDCGSALQASAGSVASRQYDPGPPDGFRAHQSNLRHCQWIWCVPSRMTWGRSMNMRLKIMALLMSLAAVPAQACAISQPQDLEIFRKAQMVVRAKVERYERQPKTHSASFDLELVKTLETRGPLLRIPRITARWRNSTFGESAQWDGPRDVIVGLRAVIDRDGTAQVEIVQQPCSLVSILPDTPENVDRVLAVLQNRPAE